MNDFDESDVSAMRQQGDLRAFMRQQIADGTARRTGHAPKPAPPPPPGHKPGGWPSGPSPPGPSPLPAAAWDQAMDDYREWLAAGSPRDQTGVPCECPACRIAIDPRSQS